MWDLGRRGSQKVVHSEFVDHVSINDTWSSNLVYLITVNLSFFKRYFDSSVGLLSPFLLSLNAHHIMTVQTLIVRRTWTGLKINLSESLLILINIKTVTMLEVRDRTFRITVTFQKWDCLVGKIEFHQKINLNRVLGKITIDTGDQTRLWRFMG